MVPPGGGSHLGVVDAEPEDATPPPKVMPAGYREGFLTAITVFLGFSLAFVRFWGLESPGAWTRIEIASAAVVGLGTAFQLYALFRSLRVEDDRRLHYVWTVRYFLVGVLLVMVGVFAAILVTAQGQGGLPTSTVRAARAGSSPARSSAPARAPSGSTRWPRPDLRRHAMPRRGPRGRSPKTESA